MVPIDNARYALNAANARWGSLYDALYGTDVISEDDGATRDGPYNPRRGDKVIAYSKGLLDEHFPLTSVSHTDSIKYSIVAGELSVDTPEGKQLLADPSQFVGHVGDADNPSSIFLSKNNLQIEIVILSLIHI